LLGVVPASGAEPAVPLDPDGGGDVPEGCVEPVVVVPDPLAPEDPELGPVVPVAPEDGAVLVLSLVELGAVPCCGWLVPAGCGCGGSTVVDDTCCVVGLTVGSGFAVTGAAAAGSVVTATTSGFGFAFFAFAE
jgi:hypothetical protein